MAADVVGALTVKDEWPLCALSISHALERHVDRLIVVDHESNATTTSGLDALRRVWGDRLQVLRLEGVQFWQEAIYALLIEESGAGPDDWMYVMDADEFVLSAPGTSLRSVLHGFAPEVSAVRYQVNNWISTVDFDPRSLAAYRGLVYRGVPVWLEDENVEVAIDRILLGSANYFDFPFASKIIVRRRDAAWIASGSHGLKYPDHVVEVAAPDDLRVAHLPLLSRERLEGRVELGRSYAALDYPREHGWQSRMLYEISEKDGLDEFWERHSMADPVVRGPGWPTAQRDDALVVALEPTLERLTAAFGDRLDLEVTGGSSPEANNDSESNAVAVRMVHTVQTIAERLRNANATYAAEQMWLVAERDAVVKDTNRMRTELLAMTTDRDRVVAELTAMETDRDRILIELGPMTEDRDRLVADLHRVVGEHDRLSAEHDRLSADQDRIGHALADLHRSTSWRITAPLRRLSARWRPRRGAVDA